MPLFKGSRILIALCLICLGFYTSVYAVTGPTPDNTENEPPIPVQMPVCDPLECVNRAMFAFNDKFDAYVLKPIAFLYNKIIPKPLNRGIHNVFLNLNNLPTIANDILQLHPYQTTSDVWRLAINTTLGIGGLFDFAACMGLPNHSNDFGLTLARWGWRESSYLVLPFFGPHTIRDTLHIPMDYYYFSIYPYIKRPYRYDLYALQIIDYRAQLLKFDDVLNEVAFDKYVFVRDAYLQHRRHEIEMKDQCPGSQRMVAQCDHSPIQRGV